MPFLRTLLKPHNAETVISALICFCLLIAHCPQDRNTRYVDIGPVNKAINMLACWLDNPASEEFER